MSLVPTSELPAGLSLRARVRIAAHDDELRLEVVVQRTPQGLVAVALAPYGPRLFAVHQTGRELRVEGPATDELGPLPLWVMDALHRAWWIAPPEAAGNDDVTRWDRDDEQVTDRRAAGRLLRREFSRWSGLALPGSSPISIDYPPASGKGMAAGVRIHNPWCGYDAVLVPLEPIQ